MTYNQLFDQTVTGAFPEGLASNLFHKVDGEFRTALLDLQEYVEYLQDGQEETFPTAERSWKCGATAVDIPIGAVVTAVGILAVEGSCMAARVHPVTERVMRGFMGNGCGVLTPVGNVDSNGFYPDQEDVLKQQGDVFAAVFGGRLYLYPQIHPEQPLAVRWRGIRRYWSNTTLVPLSWLEAPDGGQPGDAGSIINPRILSALTSHMESTKEKLMSEEQRAALRFRDWYRQVQGLISDRPKAGSDLIEISPPYYAYP